MKKIIKRGISILLTVLLVCMTQTAYAAEEDEYIPTQISVSAGSGGCYQYNEETGDFDYIPADGLEDLKLTPEGQSELQGTQTVSPKAVIGADNRSIVTNPSGVLASTCLIGARFGNLVQHGTGWLINNQYLVTAAHVVCIKGDGTSNYGVADHVAVYVGASGGTSKQYRKGHVFAYGGNYEYGNNYFSAGMFDDWAVVKLDDPVTVSVSYLGLRPVNSKSEMSSGENAYSTQGYPCDKNGCDEPGAVWDNSWMYCTSGKIMANKERYLDMVSTNLDMAPGQSGSPVWRTASDGSKVEAMVISTTYYMGNPTNCLILINDWLYNYLTTNCKA